MTHRSTNLKDLLGKDGFPAPSTHALAMRLGAIVECAIAQQIGSSGSALAAACPECIRSGVTPVVARIRGDVVQWRCLQCHSLGAVFGWPGTMFDVGLEPAESDEGDCLVFARLDELDATRLTLMSRSLRDSLALALLDRSHVVLAPSRAALTRLVQELPKTISGLRSVERISAERFAARCDAALLSLGVREDAERTMMH